MNSIKNPSPRQDLISAALRAQKRFDKNEAERQTLYDQAVNAKVRLTADEYELFVQRYHAQKSKEAL